MRKLKNALFAGGPIVLAALIAVPAQAQQEDQQPSQKKSAQKQSAKQADQQSSQQERQAAERRQREQSQQRRDQREAQATRQLRLMPEGWVRVGVDYDNDGDYDAYEVIYFFDLQKARESSLKRRQAEAKRQRDRQQARTETEDSRRRTGFRGTVERERRLRRAHSFEGTIGELAEVKITDSDEPHVLARVKTADGNIARVDLGPKSSLSNLDLQRGDQLFIEGRPGRIDDRPMLMAVRIETGEQSVKIDRPRGRMIKRVRGEIRSTRTANFRGFDDPHVLAQVRLKSGRTAMVNLGPQSKLSGLDLQQGDQIAILVRPARINGEPGLVAEQIRANSQTVNLPRPRDKRRFGGSGQNARESR